MSFLQDLMAACLPHPSAWRLVNSGSVSVDVGTPIARVYVSGTGGTFYMGMGPCKHIIPYTYAGVGGGVGIGLEIPVNASVSTPSFPSTGGEWGRLYVLPGIINVADVNKDTISGPAVLISPNVAWFGAGGYASMIFFGATVHSGLDAAFLLTSANAVAFQAGLQVITPGLGVSCTAYQLYIGGAGKIQRV